MAQSIAYLDKVITVIRIQITKLHDHEKMLFSKGQWHCDKNVCGSWLYSGELSEVQAKDKGWFWPTSISQPCIIARDEVTDKHDRNICICFWS